MIPRRISESDQAITIGWDPVPGQVGYVPRIDGNEKLTDGKRHIGYPSTATQVRIGKPQDGLPHKYGVRILGTLDEGDYEPGGTPPVGPTPPQGTLQVRDGGGTAASFPDCWRTTVDPFTVKGKHVKNVTFSGVGSQQPWVSGPSNNLPVVNPGRTVIEDCIVENVSRPRPGESGGTGEGNAWLGNPTDMRRCVLRGPSGWMLMNLVARSQGSVIEDVLFDGKDAVAVGAYLEHATHHIVFRRCVWKGFVPRPVAGGNEPLGILAARSITGEWAYTNPIFGGRVCPHTVDFEDCEIYCPPRDPRFEAGPTEFDPSAGSYWGPGCHTIRYLGNTRFVGPGWAILAPEVRLGPDVYIAPTVRFDNGGARLSYHDLPMGA